MKRITPTITPSLGVNWEQFGKASSMPGLLLARDLIDEQIRILQGDIQDPKEAPEQQFTPGVPVSLRDFRKGTEAYRRAYNHNQNIYRRRRKADDQKRVMVASKSEAARSAWASKSPAERKKWIAAIQAARARNAAAKQLNGAA